MSSWRELRRDLGFARGLLLGRPFNVLLQVTNRCNLRCPFCGFRQRAVEPDQELSYTDYQRLERQLSRTGRFVVSLEGGEPFLRDDVVELVRLFSRRHVTLLYTNGWFVDQAAAEAVFGAGLGQVGVSLDYPRPALHDAHRGREGAFNRAYRAVQRLRDAAPNGGKQVHVMTLLTAETAPHLEEFLRLTDRLGVSHAVTLASSAGPARGDGFEQPRPPLSAHLLELFGRFPHMRTFREYLEGIDRFLEGDGLPACQAGRQSFNVAHQGHVSPCIEMLDRPVGNIRHESLERLLGRMRDLDEVAGCQRCWSLCRGFPQALAGRGNAASWRDLVSRMQSSAR